MSYTPISLTMLGINRRYLRPLHQSNPITSESSFIEKPTFSLKEVNETWRLGTILMAMTLLVVLYLISPCMPEPSTPVRPQPQPQPQLPPSVRAQPLVVRDEPNV
ncbi:hypothetical protein ACFE04_003514 [Oxalis oulophora]